MIQKVDDSGDVVLPAELIQAPPQTALEAERSGDAVILRLAGAEKETPAAGSSTCRRSLVVQSIQR